MVAEMRLAGELYLYYRHVEKTAMNMRMFLRIDVELIAVIWRE